MYLNRKGLWDCIFSGQWAEIIVPTVSPVGNQIIGCLIPVDKFSTSELRRVSGFFVGDHEETEVTLVTKPFGERNRQCLSVVHHFRECYLSQPELARAEECLTRQIFWACGMGSIVSRYINHNHALIRLT